ncbi:DNA repair protein RecN [Ruminococcaceae bacterium OttesenSCG-928-O06]|nr:DNA repair protein RecN [Ruminococcaceae bacterium OttesenSCG-928-O06]
MLCEITIENVAVIERAGAAFSQGFTVLTGETGAGKSILIDSINAILGSRTSRDIVRAGASRAAVWASFTHLPKDMLARLADAGYEMEDELLLHREISADGKSTCRVNGAPATAAILRDICGDLVNIHGQHDNQSLLNPARHIDILDTFAQNSRLLEEYYTAYRAYSALQKEMDALHMDESERLRRVDLLRFEVEEIDAAQLQPGEEEQLVEQRNIVLHARRIMSALENAYLLLSGGDEDEGAATQLSRAAEEMADAAGYAAELAPFAESLRETYYAMAELASDLQHRVQDYAFEGGSLEELEGRLDTIYRLKSKYGGSTEAVLSYGDNARGQLEQMEGSTERLAALAAQLPGAQKEMERLAAALTKARKEAFGRLNAEISEALAYLNMPGITMVLAEKTVPCGPRGADEMEFYIATNPGETPKPLAKIASGGELARIMLAIKSALADRDAVPTVIYDEIDTGISGLAAGRIGQLLRSTAKGRQVICVTHTAQIAAFAQRHLLIEKTVRDGRTYTEIRELDDAERVEELARIISGDAITDIARANAREMLQLAAEKR